MTICTIDERDCSALVYRFFDFIMQYEIKKMEHFM